MLVLDLIFKIFAVVEVVVVRMEMAGCIIVCGGVGIVVVADTVGRRS